MNIKRYIMRSIPYNLTTYGSKNKKEKIMKIISFFFLYYVFVIRFHGASRLNVLEMTRICWKMKF